MCAPSLLRSSASSSWQWAWKDMGSMELITAGSGLIDVTA